MPKIRKRILYEIIISNNSNNNQLESTVNNLESDLLNLDLDNSDLDYQIIENEVYFIF